MTLRSASLVRAGGRRLAGLLALTVVAGTLSVSGAAPAAAETLPTGFSAVTTPTGPGTAVEAAWAPDGRLFVAEKGGKVKVVLPDGTVVPVLDLRARVNSYSDRGLLGLATDRDFATNGWLYLLYSQELEPANPDESGPMTSVLTRVTVRPDSTVVNPSAPETVILGKDGATPCPTPDNARDCMPADHYWHVIGTVRSDPVDGTLWVGSGDAHRHQVDATSYRPYDEATTAGKILHIDRDGKGLAGHPFCAGETDLTKTCTKVYAKGFRNPFRFHLRAGKGPIVGDVGAEQQEEINLIAPGRNYGWPCYEGTVRTYLYAATSTCAAVYAQEGTAAAATGPAWSYAHGGGASVVAGPAYAGSSYPADMQGDVFVGDYVQGWVKRLDVDSQDRVTGASDFVGGWTGVSLLTAPNGDLADVDMGWVSGAPAVRRYAFSAAGNQAPVARATSTPTSGPAPLTVAFDGSASSDPDGDALTFSWDFGDGTTGSTQTNPSHTYSSTGTFTATLTVRDPAGARSTASVTVTVGSNTAPTVSITAPAEGATYRNGVAVPLTGAATDAEDGTLTGTSLTWQVLLQHGTHLHQVATPTGESTSFTPLVDHDADSHYELRLTATDSAGATATAVRTIRPRTATLTLDSTPAGAGVTYEGAEAVAPYTRGVALGFSPTVGAVERFVSDGVTYQFDSWSDGGAREHAITMTGARTLTARYVEAPDTEELVFTPSADTYVYETYPTTSYGSSSRLIADASPALQSFARFGVSGVNGREVLGAKLLLRQTEVSDSGGRVRAVSGAWSESTTWSTKPALGEVLAEVPGPVSAGVTYEVPLPATAVTGDGDVSVGMDTLSRDGLTWASRSTATPPQLVLTVESPPPPVGDEVVFTPSMDTYVNANGPTATHGGSARLRIDADPMTEAYTRFLLNGVTGRTVLGVKLRLRQTDASGSGGRVRAVSGAWTNATTWSTKPTLGTVLAEVPGPVSAGNTYEVSLPTSVVTADGALSLGFDTLSRDAAVWASKETATPPELVVTLAPPPVGDEVVFTPTADTYVNANGPTTTHAGSARLRIDADPMNEAYARFAVSGVSGRTVLGVKLRLRQTDASASGGRVRAVSGAWTNATTWSTKPTLGAVLAEVPGPVSAGNTYEVSLPVSTVTGDGGLSLGFDTLSRDAAVWASRETATPPELVVTLAPLPPSTDLVFTPTVDTYVNENVVTATHGGSARLRVDNDPATEAYARFGVTGLAGRQVLTVKLRLRQTDASASGGRVRAVSGAWTNSTSWSTKPTLGVVLAEVPGPVSAGNTYEVSLPPSVVSADGAVSFGFDTLHHDAIVWASRETATPPELVVTVAS